MTPPTGYTEDALVEQPDLLADLGWETINAYPESVTGHLQKLGKH